MNRRSDCAVKNCDQICCEGCQLFVPKDLPEESPAPIIGLRLVRVVMDTLENNLSDAIITKEIGIFVDDHDYGKTAFLKIRKYFESLEPERMYVGWNNQVYPQYRIETVNLK